MGKRILLVVLALLALPTAWVVAQTATPTPNPTGYGDAPPAALNTALADLNTRLNLQLNLETSFNDATSRWQWIERDYANTALDCANPGEAFAIKGVRGYEFLFVYRNRTYDYRIAKDDPAAVLRRCFYWDTLPTAPASATAAATTQAVTTSGGGTTTDISANGTPGASAAVRSDGTPEAVYTALGQLNTLLKTNLTLQDLSTATTAWKWVPQTFTDDALNCARSGYTPITGTYPGYLISLTYRGTVYEYRANQTDPTSTFLCARR